MYTVINCQVGVSSGPVFEYFDKITKAGNCLYNATLFRIRQVLTLTEKPPEKWTDNEREVYDEILKSLPLMPKKFAMPTKGRSILSYEFLNALLKASDNPDYRREGLPVQSAQHVIKDAVRAMKSFRHATKEYYKKPSSFTGKPKLPGYHQKGGNSTIILTNQDCVVYPKKDGPGCEVKFPKFDKRKTNQSFVQVPFSKLRSLITYRAERYGIQVIEREESYTSKASFLDNDYIPTYGVDDKNAHFSGTRPKRGIYKAKDGTRINADLNGSGNILRKEFPSAFCEDGQVPDFNSVIIIRHPDYDRATANRKKQLSVPHIDSKSKLRRLAKKEKRNPSGIELCE